MKHVLILKDHRGTTEIEVKLWTSDFTDRNGKNFRYDIIVWNTPPKKRSKTYMEHSFVSDQEIYAAKMELWNKINP